MTHLVSTFSFLFGTCCLLAGDIETSLVNNNNKLKENEPISTREPIYMSSKPQIINNQFYGANSDDNSLLEDTKFSVSHQAVVVTSPAYSDNGASLYNNPTEPSTKITQYGASHEQGYSTELPTRIYGSSFAASSTSEEDDDLTESIQFSEVPYDHSDISYSPSDAEILMEDGSINNNRINQYPMSTPETTYAVTTHAEGNDKNKFSKPIFKLKPTTSYPSSTEKYVLVHTISNNKQTEQQEIPTKRPSTNESIQSIILMLNGSNPGPEYEIDSVHSNYNSGSGSTPSYGSTSMIDREKYGSSSYYITTKAPTYPTTLNVPSTSYVYSPNPTRRATTKTTTTKSANRVKITPTRSPQKPTTLNVPSTSHVYSAKPIPQRPGSTPTILKDSPTTTMKKKPTTTPRPSIIVKRPTAEVENNYVVISGGGITKNPSPTVHITPKPITNVLTASTLSQLNIKQQQQSKRPSNDSPSTPGTTARPPFVSSTTPIAFVSSSIFVPAIQDFHNEGYFVVTHRPAVGVSSTAVYAINSGTVNQIKVPGVLVDNDPANFDYAPPSQNDDFSNFPPVRNPNLNMTAANNVLDESEIATPSFVEDEQLNSKIDLLVSKLVASMQGNLDNLIDIVYERKNISTAEHDINNLNKNGTILQNSKPTKTPGSPKTTTQRVPAKVTTGRPSQQQTTKKAPAKTTSKKPTTGTKKPTTKPSATSKKPPSRVTTTVATRKPTKKVATTSTTERAPVSDEIIEEEAEENADETVEEEEETIEEEGNEATFPPLENGKIRKRTFCNYINVKAHHELFFFPL